MKRLIIRVSSIKGRCPVYEVGHKIVIDEGYKLNLRETTSVCMHSLASIMPYYVALSKGVPPAQLGLANQQGTACVQCLDPGEQTGGGTVTFEIQVTETANW
jgi:uncharacterized repeat protein (TIGR04076 family)